MMEKKKGYDIQHTLSNIIGKECKIFIKQDYVITGIIYSIDNFFNFLIYDSSIIKVNKESRFNKCSFLRFIRGEVILYIFFKD